MKYGMLTVLGDASAERGERRKISVRCACGRELAVRLCNLQSGNTKSCGCARGRHHMYRSAEYKAWQKMWQRCTNPKATGYEHWGGRGITVCRRWKNFESFLADLGCKPTATHRLDRKKNEKNYTPGNCRWVTPTESNRNTRANLKINYKGQEMCLKEAAALAGVPYSTARFRYHRGWAPEAVLCA